MIYLKHEEWRSLKGLVELGDNYEVSNCGNVRNIEKGINMKFDRSSCYSRVHLSKDGERRKYLVHRLVALAFIKNKDSHPIVNHIDGNKLNNNVSNLEWCTHAYNTNHAFENGLMDSVPPTPLKGEDNAMSKLRDEDVYRIVEDWNTGKYTLKALGEKYNISKSSVTSITLRKSWKHLNIDITHKRDSVGKSNSMSKLNEEDVCNIVKDWNTGVYNQKNLAEKYRVTISNISCILKGKSWKHLNLNIKEKGCK